MHEPTLLARAEATAPGGWLAGYDEAVGFGSAT